MTVLTNPHILSKTAKLFDNEKRSLRLAGNIDAKTRTNTFDAETNIVATLVSASFKAA